jgi:2-isopropylmalate synthase
MKKSAGKSITVYDTTLRDGSQALGISLSISDKLRLAQRLSDLGVHYIEGGWPMPSNPVDREFFARVRSLKLKAKVASFGSTRRKGVSASKDPLLAELVKYETPAVTIFGKSWDLHVHDVLHASLAENLDMIAESVAFLRKHVDEVFYDAEHFFDGYRANPSYATQCLEAARDAGADCLVLCDTNGGMLPAEFLATLRAVRAHISAPLGVHTHNDSGCAEANSLIAVSEGVTHVQGTINGLGERCGNANLCTIIPGLQLKMGMRVLSDAQLASLTETSLFVSEIANVSPNIRQPYVGEAAFSHKAGTHADAVRKTSRSFEHLPPESVGNTRRFVVSEHAGAGTILEKLKDIRSGLDKKDPLVQKVLKRILDMENQGYQFEAADASFELVARETLGMFTHNFDVQGFRVIEEQRASGELHSEATIKVCKNGEFEHTAADGDGPVNALDNALRKALVKFYPTLREVKLEDFKVRVLDGKAGTEAKVRVLIESSDGKDFWGTVGVSTNIIEASWLALVDSLRYKLMKDRVKK